MAPWRRRLADLRQLIRQAEQVYFEPDLFRLNVNNAIQTSRTVTFLIQKHKDTIPNFDNWYKANVLDPLADDPIMTWLKDARNHIEKEGDLEINSECNLEAIYSYTDPSPKISLKHDRLVFAGVKRLTRHMRDVFPAGVFRDSAIAIDRRWVANSLPEVELLSALQYGYEKLESIVNSLDVHTGNDVPDLPGPKRLSFNARQRRMYLKTEDGSIYIPADSQLDIDEQMTANLAQKYDLQKFRAAARSTRDPEQALAQFTDTASHVFTQAGTHVSIGFLLNETGDPLQIVGPQFSDHADKLIFWTDLGRLARTNEHFCGLIYVSEIWLRSVEGFPERRISDLPITGEGLQIVVANLDTCLLRTIPIVRHDKEVHLDTAATVDIKTEPNFLVPLRRAWNERVTK